MINYIIGAGTTILVGAALHEVTKGVARDSSYLDIYRDRDEMSEEQYNEEIDRRARRKVEQMKRELGID